MRALRARVGLLVLLGLLAGVSCGDADGGPDGIDLLVNVQGLLPDVTMLQTRAVLGGVAAAGRFEIRHNLRRFAVHLSDRDGERGTLRLLASGHADDRCKVATGWTDVSLIPGQRSYEVDLFLEPLPEKRCTITVRKPDGGIVTSKPEGIFCGDLCEADFPVGSPVELTAQRGDRPIQTGWGIECRSETYGITNTCTVPALTQPVLVNARITDASCSESGWCWTYPPRGRPLNRIWGSDANNVWAVGDGGAVLRWDGSAWSPQSSGTAKNLYGVWGSSANNVWAVGAGGTVIWWDGTAWTARPSGTTSDLYGVWGSDASHVWAVGAGGTVLSWDGTAWTGQTIGTSARLEDVWGSDEDTVWAVGSGGTVVKLYGNVWVTERGGGSLPTLHGVQGTDASNVWAVGDHGTVLRLNGSVWTSQRTDVLTPFFGVWGRAADNVWAVGYSAVRKWNGAEWSTQSRDTGQTLLSVWGSGAGDVWAVGADGAILRYYPQK